MCTLPIFRHVSADFAFSIREWPEYVTNIYHFCFNLQLNFMFYYIEMGFLVCILQCATSPKVQILAHYTKQKILLTVCEGQIN